MKQKITLIFLLSISVLLTIDFALADSGIIKTGIGVVVRGTPTTNSTQKCGNNITSCGPPGNCMDLRDVKYCIDGKIYEMRCYANEPKKVRTSVPCKNIEFALNITDENGAPNSLILKIISSSGVVLNSSSINGFNSFSIANQTIDLQFEYDDSKFIFLLRNVNLDKIGSKASHIIINKVNTTIPNVNVYKAYRVELPSNFTYSTVTLKIKYSDINFINESNITVYKCSSFNPSTNTCNENWTKITPTEIDKTNKIILLEINSFSVYVLGEPMQTTTTTTLPTTTTTIACSCTSWVNEGCGLSPCPPNRMKMSRVCSPLDCDTQTQCVEISACVASPSSVQQPIQTTTTTTQVIETTTTTAASPTTTTVPQTPIEDSSNSSAQNKTEELEERREEQPLIPLVSILIPSFSTGMVIGTILGFFLANVYSNFFSRKLYSKRVIYKRLNQNKVNQQKLKSRNKEKFHTVLQL